MTALQLPNAAPDAGLDLVTNTLRGMWEGLLARLPDSHVLRKYGAEAAETVRREAARALARLDAGTDPEQLVPELLAWDAALKRRGLNPGTSADLTVAVIFAWRLRNGLRHPAFAG